MEIDDKIKKMKETFLELFDINVSNSVIEGIVSKYNKFNDKEKEAIDFFKLKDKSRVRTKVYMRAYISSVFIEQGLSLSEIGRRLNRDHSSIVHYKKLFDNFKDDKFFLNEIKPIATFLESQDDE